MPARAPRLPTALLLSLAVAAVACGADPQDTGSSFTGAPTSTVPPVSDESSEASTAPPTTTGDTSTSSPVDPTTTSDTSTDDTSTGDGSSTGEPVDLCAHLGGMDPVTGIPAVVADFIARALADDRVNGYFLNTDVDGAALTTCVSDQLGALAECAGVTYACADMTTAHAGLGISDIDLADFLELLADALAAGKADRPDLTDADIEAITTSLLALAPEIVEDPGHDATLYQRAGRKPNLRKIVGDADKSASLLGIVAEDNAINGFFLGADWPRLSTCLTRQLASIDGPVVYGAEVNAPDGVEPGVAADDPCKPMATVHAGLQDDLLTLITIDDFMAFMADLAEALENYDVAAEDRELMLASLSALCPDIVVETNDCPGNNITVVTEAKDLALSLADINGKYNGTLGTMACVDLEVADDGVNFIRDARFGFAMDHTWLGDVTVKLVHPEGKILTVVSRTGDPNGALPDSSEGCCGDDSNFSAAYPVTFNDLALWKGADIGKGPTMKTNAVVCKDESPPHIPCEWKPFPGMGPGVAFSDFAGMSAVGVWKACFGDSGDSDIGTLSSVSLSLDKVKDP